MTPTGVNQPAGRRAGRQLPTFEKGPVVVVMFENGWSVGDGEAGVGELAAFAQVWPGERTTECQSAVEPLTVVTVRQTGSGVLLSWGVSVQSIWYPTVAGRSPGQLIEGVGRSVLVAGSSRAVCCST
jgi:hypothetical protein